jgi:dihydrofolate synthase / folylpolyglutamate synthase
MNIRNFEEANQVLAHYVPNIRSTSGYTLDRMRTLMGLLGNPQNQLKIVHVAGTSGKTSTSYYTAALLKAIGKKVGLTVSPHVDRVNERLQIDSVPLPEREFCSELAAFLEIVEAKRITPSYFELMVAFAYWEFAKQRVDYAVVEVGLGGLLDATNVVSREDKVCVITDIGLDHIDRLGNTLAEIAAQKAGIIQNNNVVFCHNQEQLVLDVLKDRCQQQHATLHVIKNDTQTQDFESLPLFQQRNFSLARAAIAYVCTRDKLTAPNQQQLQHASHTLIPGRMEIVQTQDKIIILDGAHNAQKLQALFSSIAAKYPGQNIAALISFADGRSYRLESSIHKLISNVASLIITRFVAGQDLPHGPVEPDKLVTMLKQQGFMQVTTTTDPKKAFSTLLNQPEPVLLVTGSFFLINDIRSLALHLK